MKQEEPGSSEWVVIARVVGPRGNRGEVQAIPLSDRPERYQNAREVFLVPVSRPDGEHRRFTVENVWWHKGRIIIKFQGIDSISEAERWRDCEVRVPLATRPVLPPDEYYQSDLVGYEVVERNGGQSLGRVRGWREYGGPALLEVEAPGGGEILIPFAGAICVQVDAGARRIVVEMPEGLKDLNRR